MEKNVILFDINETVLDLSSLNPLFEDVFGHVDVTALWFSTLLHTSTVCAITGVNTNFANLARSALNSMAQGLNVDLSNEAQTKLLNGFASLPAHRDVKHALSILKSSGFRTVAFSNSSQELIATQIANAGLTESFDEIISVESTGSFKPDARVYRFAAECLGLPLTALRLVATHDWDTHGALTVGMKAAYINRTGGQYHPLYLKPDVSASSMQDIAEQIIAIDG